MSQPIEIRALAGHELGRAFQVLKLLRVHLTEDLFLERLQRQQRAGYRLVGAFLPELQGLLGMRPVETMARGFHLHVDDLIVRPEMRGQGIGRRLLEWAEKHAKERDMLCVFLDSRPEVIGFYRRRGYGEHSATLMRKEL